MEIQKALLETAISEADLDEEKIRYDYSGRGMMGQTCFGVTGSLSDFVKFMIALSWQDEDGLLSMQLADQIRTDDMARETIFYFPYVTVVG